MTELSIEQLREALEVSPENAPLRKLLAHLLLDREEAVQAEVEFRKLLSESPNDTEVKLGLATCFYKQHRDDAALVLIENILESPSEVPLATSRLYVRILIRQGNIEQAVEAYKHMITLDPTQADEEVEQALGVAPSNATGEVIDGRLRENVQEPPVFPESMLEKPLVRFVDVGGMENVKEEIGIKIVQPMRKQELFSAYGKAVGGGILMYGPPGCGKTYLARATAGEVNSGFLSVGVHDVLDMWIGQSERNLHELFEQARLHKPCILFFDEVDALGASRTDMKQSSGRHLINQFLAELDGVKSSNDGVMILAATNAPWHLDQAFRRPGRFDNILFVPPPDQDARTAILKILLREKPVLEIDYLSLSKKTYGFSGADLKAVVDRAVENTLREAIKRGHTVQLTTRDLTKAIKQVRPSTREWFNTARNYAMYSNQSGLYDDILSYLNL